MSRTVTADGGVDEATPADSHGLQGSKLTTKTVNRLISVVSVLAFFGAWELAAAREWINTLFMSSPSLIWSAGVDLVATGELWRHLLASGRLFLMGFFAAIVVAIPLGVALGWYPRLSAVFDPFVSILYVTPRIALIPLLFIWFGIGFRAQAIIVFLAALFPLLINTIAGVKAVDSNLLKVARSFQARDLDIFRTLALPTAVPYIVSGLRLSMTMGLIGVVVAEFFTGNVGIGAMITRAGISLRTDVVFVGVAVIAALALTLTAGLRAAEARLSRWRVDQE